MPFDIGSIGASAVGGLMGLAFGGIQDKRQLKQQEKLNKLQENTSRNLMDYQNQLAMDMWNKTNYSAQVDQLKKAGLNPALLYGMKGGGGITTGNASSSAGGSQAPHGGNEVRDFMAIGLQQQMMQSQIELNKSQAEKNKAEADSTRGIEGTIGASTIADLTQGIQNKKAQEKLTNAQRILTELESDYNEDTLSARTDMLYKQLSILTNDASISEQTLNNKITIIQQQALHSILQNELTKANINKTNTEITQIVNSILQKWEEIGIGKEKNAIEAFKAEFNANNPGISQVTGKIIDDAIETLYEIGGIKRIHNKTIK